MQKLTERRAPLIKLLLVILLVLLCYKLSQAMLFSTLCKRQDRNIPPNTEVLVSACKRPSTVGVPGGEVLFVYERSINKIYLLDLRTGERRDVPNDPLLRGERIVFLSPDLVWVEGDNVVNGILVGPGDPGYRPDYILDLANGQRYELLDLTLLPRLEDGKFNPANYVYIQSAESVFIHAHTLIALSTNFHTNQNGRVIFNELVITTDDDKFLEKLMGSWGMDYEMVDLSLDSLDYTDVPSPTGKYFVRDEGIFLSSTNKQVVETRRMSYYFKSWYYDETGVIVQEFPTHWIRSPFFGSYYQLYNPVLKLRLPVQ